MQSEGKRTLLATALCVVVLVGWFRFYAWMYPPEPPTTTTAPAGDDAAAVADGSAATRPGGASTSAPSAEPVPTVQGTGPAAPGSVSGDELVAVGGEPVDAVPVGDDQFDRASNAYRFMALTTGRGAAVESITLAEHRRAVAKNRTNPDHDPYVLTQPIIDKEAGRTYLSFASQSVRVDGERLDLADVIWTLADQGDGDDGRFAMYQTVIRRGGVDLVRLRKTFRAEPGSPHLVITHEVKNLSGKPRTVLLTEGGPIGVSKEEIRMDFRRVVAGVIGEDGQVTLGDDPTRKDVFDSKELDELHVQVLRPGENKKPLWTSVGNKYFAVIVAPQPADSKTKYPAYLGSVTARTRLGEQSEGGDLTFEYDINAGPIPAGATRQFTIHAYCGPKSSDALEAADPDAHYYTVTIADRTFCNIEFISTAMLALLSLVKSVIGNFGIAIIMLVVIVKGVLHPIAKRSQINMMKMQKASAQIKPKMDALQKQFKGDKQKLQEATMKLYREEGFNPAGQFLGCLPMLLQMPIWIALWTTLNTNVDMRHQPFFLWIRDLSAPDALIAFDGSYSIPLLSVMMGPITSLNLLPIVMAATMFLQQKLTQKLTKPDRPVTPKVDADGNPVVDQQAQMQKMMGPMMLFMGLIFYNFPSGLCLYILTSNLLGMAEQWQIRKHLREKEDRGDFEIKKKGGPPSGGAMKKLMDWADKKGEQARLQQSQRPARARKKRR